MSNDVFYMKQALTLAKAAAAAGEVPVGAVVVCDGEVVGIGENKRERGKDPFLHAETVAVRDAAQRLGRWNLSDCTLYVTLEPCPMCAGALIQARVGRVVYGAADERGGAVGGVCDLFAMPFTHRPLVKSGVLEEECAAVLKEFFENKR